MTWEMLDKIMRKPGSRLYDFGNWGVEVYHPDWGESKFRRVHPRVAWAWLRRDYGVISDKNAMRTVYRHKYVLT